MHLIRWTTSMRVGRQTRPVQNIGCAVTVNNSTEVVDMKLVFTEGYPVMFETRCRWHLIIMIHSDAHG